MKIGDKVKTKLIPQQFVCTNYKGEGSINWFHWWQITKIENNIAELTDSQGQILRVDVKTKKALETNQIIYKIKSK